MNLLQKDKKFIWHPYTQVQTDHEPKVITHGKGAYLFDEKGNKYLDAIASWWVNIHGHAEPYIAKKIAEQAMKLEQVIFAGFTHEPAINLAERILKKLPGDYAKVFYSDNGSTAVEVALKMALQYFHNRNEPRKKIIAFKNSYHGDTFGAMSASSRSVFTNPFSELLFDVIHVEPPTPGKEELAIQQLKKVIGKVQGLKSKIKSSKKTNFKHQTLNFKHPPACFIFEPLVLGAGGMLMYEPEPLNEMLKICRDSGILTIADEVMTGFGRTGKLFAIDFLAEQPDIICLSKGITGGFMPLGLTACTAEIFNTFLSDDRTKTFFHGHSYTANPLACAAANASLDLTEKKEFKQNLKRIHQKHQAFIKKIKNNPKIQNARVSGTILAFELETSNLNKQSSNYLNPHRNKIYDYFISKGFLLRPLGNTVYLMPPYCITNQELDSIYHAVLSY